MKKKAFCAALPYSLPICIGFLFIAMSYGFLMRSRGFSVFYPMAMSAFISPARWSSSRWSCCSRPMRRCTPFF